MEVVRVHHPRARQPHRARHVLGLKPAPQQPDRRARRAPSVAESRASSSAGSPSCSRTSHSRSSTTRSSPPGGAVAVVQEQDHLGECKPRLLPSMTLPASIVIPTRARLPYLEVALASIGPQAAAPAPRCW